MRVPGFEGGILIQATSKTDASDSKLCNGCWCLGLLPRPCPTSLTPSSQEGCWDEGVREEGNSPCALKCRVQSGGLMGFVGRGKGGRVPGAYVSGARHAGLVGELTQHANALPPVQPLHRGGVHVELLA